jgi:teichuronic acid biosynthesis glycosyltransferase TuaC
MRLLVVAANYPYEGNRFSGIFNQRSVEALEEHCESVAVLAPRPYVPALFGALPLGRWQAYARSKSHSMTGGIPVYRPGYFHMPRMASAFWHDQSAFFFARGTAKKLHERYKFDAILSFGLIMAGSTAWRLSRDLGIPAAGWATGSDIRVVKGTPGYRSVARTLGNLDLVLYQSQELRDLAAEIMEHPGALTSGKHLVLTRGICEPPQLSHTDLRRRVRFALEIADEDILVLYVGRVVRGKGMMELLEAMSIALRANAFLKFVIVGSKPAFDDSNVVQKALDETPELRKNVRLLPECDPERVWEYLCAADIFAFPSHKEGMPNSLLEAMAMGVPAVTFAIPPVLELDGGSGALIAVPPLSADSFAHAILQLAASPESRRAIGGRGKAKVLQNFMVRASMSTALGYLSRTVKQCVSGAMASPVTAGAESNS